MTAPTESSEEGEATAEGLRDSFLRTGRVLKQAGPGAKLVVIGAPDMVSDLGLGLGNYYTSFFGLRGDYENSVIFIRNLIEWCVADSSLLEIRSTGSSTRILRSLDADEQGRYELINYVIALVALLIFTLIAVLPRRFSAV